jgi:hypothetical protein
MLVTSSDGVGMIASSQNRVYAWTASWLSAYVSDSPSIILSIPGCSRATVTNAVVVIVESKFRTCPLSTLKARYLFKAETMGDIYSLLN